MSLGCNPWAGPVQIPKDVREAMAQRRSCLRMRQWGEQRKPSSSEQPQETQREISEISFQKDCQGEGGERYEGVGLFLLFGQEDGRLGLFLSREL